MTIDEHMTRYRHLKAQADALKVEMDELKTKIQPLVPPDGWKDELGYARHATYPPSVSYDNKSVRALQEAWCGSENVDIRSCGDMLAQHRKTKAGRRVLQLK